MSGGLKLSKLLLLMIHQLICLSFLCLLIVLVYDHDSFKEPRQMSNENVFRVVFTIPLPVDWQKRVLT